MEAFLSERINEEGGLLGSPKESPPRRVADPMAKNQEGKKDLGRPDLLSGKNRRRNEKLRRRRKERGRSKSDTGLTKAKK